MEHDWGMHPHDDDGWYNPYCMCNMKVNDCIGTVDAPECGSGDPANSAGTYCQIYWSDSTVHFAQWWKCVKDRDRVQILKDSKCQVEPDWENGEHEWMYGETCVSRPP